MFRAGYDGDVLIVEASESYSNKKQSEITNCDFFLYFPDCVFVVYLLRSSLHVKFARPCKSTRAGDARP